MKQERKDLIDEFDKWLDTNPSRNLVNLQCAIIAEKYAKEQVIKELEGLLKVVEDYDNNWAVHQIEIMDRIEELKQT